MIIPVKCFTCGQVLADKYRYYKQETIRRKQEQNINPNEILYLTQARMDKTIEGEIMDELGLKKMCCRRHLLTHVDIMN